MWVISGREKEGGITMGNIYEEKRGEGNHTAYQGGHCITLESLEPSGVSVAC